MFFTSVMAHFILRSLPNMQPLNGILIVAIACISAVQMSIAVPTGSFPTNTLPSGPSSGPCPPPKFGNLTSFIIAAYIRAPWYIQKQVR